MDILSRLFDEMHLQQVQYISVQANGDWQLEQTKKDYLTFIVVMSGEIVLNYADQYQVITANNMVMLTSQQGYCCQSSQNLSNATVTTNMPAHKEGQINLLINDYDNKHKTETNIHHLDETSDSTEITALARFIVVRSQFDADMARPLLSSLPNSLPPTNQQHSPYNEVVRIGLQFFQLEVGLQRPGKTTMLERLASMLMIECIREYVEQLKTASTTALIKNPMATLITDSMTTQQEISIANSTNKPVDAWVDNPWQLSAETQSEESDDDSLFNTIKEENSGNWLAALKDPYLSKTLYLMHSYPQEAWTLQGLAKESGLSRSSLSERFRQLIGITPQAYLNHYRLRLAARFLRQEQYSIGKISELVGYASDHSFSGAFKRRYGQSPSNYRKDFIKRKDSR